MQSFVRQANGFGAERRPFFFLIDFEQQKPLIFPLDQLSGSGIYFDFGTHRHLPDMPAVPLTDFRLQKQPMSLAQYRTGFDWVQWELQQGNSYLLNLTYPTPISLTANLPVNLTALFHAVHAPYKLLLDGQFVCFSPERFIQIRRNRIYTYPMKGTINAALPDAEQRLLNDEKERREHYTIVDLMRNDLAMVAENIRVARFRYVERIATQQGDILQTSSEICGDLAANWQKQVGILLATLLPAGSISGAPKQKTVEIIQQAEGQPRGYYTGVFGIFDGDSLQSAVAIRFIEQSDEQSDGQGCAYFFRSGGGITIHSEVAAEYAELLEKVYLPLD